MVRSLVLAATLAVAGCGGDDGPCDADATPVTVVCEAGKSDACACPDGSTGAQVCDDDGSRWGSCECAGGVGDGGAGSHARPYAYYGKDQCGAFKGTEHGCVALFGEIFFSIPRSDCIVPDDGEIVDCTKLSDTLWCCSS